MGRKISPFEKELYQRTDEVMHYVWDPIGVSRIPQARDEYDSYVAQVFSMLLGRKTASEIATYLSEIERDRMGLAGAPERAAQVAALLTHWLATLRSKYEVT